MDPVLQQLVDRQAITDTLARYCERLDEYDLDGMAATFCPDAVTDYGPGRGGRIEGRAAIRARIASGQAAFRRTSHQLGQSLVTVHGDEAEAVTYVTAWHEWRDDGRQEALRLRYLDRLRRVDGQWLIASRRVEALGVEGFAGVEWMWVPRAEPG